MDTEMDTMAFVLSSAEEFYFSKNRIKTCFTPLWNLTNLQYIIISYTIFFLQHCICMKIENRKENLKSFLNVSYIGIYKSQLTFK